MMRAAIAVETNTYLLTISKQYEQAVDILGAGGVHEGEGRSRACEFELEVGCRVRQGNTWAKFQEMKKSEHAQACVE